MNIPEVAEKWTGTVSAVEIGATPDKGGTRGGTVTIGGAATLPFLAFEGGVGHRPVIALEIWDGAADQWPGPLREAYGDSMSSPTAWARKAVEFGADLICLRLMDAHPDAGDRSPDQCAATVREVLGAVDVPLIIWGCGIDEKDNEVLPAVST